MSKDNETDTNNTPEFDALMATDIAQDTSEAILEKIESEIAIAAGATDARCSHRNVFEISASDQMFFSDEKGSARKLYFHCHSGKCDVKLWEKKADYEAGRAPIHSEIISAGYDGKVFYRRHGDSPRYVRITSVEVPLKVYVHFEWNC